MKLRLIEGGRFDDHGVKEAMAKAVYDAQSRTFETLQQELLVLTEKLGLQGTPMEKSKALMRRGYVVQWPAFPSGQMPRVARATIWAAAIPKLRPAGALRRLIEPVKWLW